MKQVCTMTLWIAVAVFGITSLVPSSSRAEPNVVDTWKLVSFVVEELATGNTTALLGEHPKGYLIYTPEGRMMMLLLGAFTRVRVRIVRPNTRPVDAPTVRASCSHAGPAMGWPTRAGAGFKSWRAWLASALVTPRSPSIPSHHAR